MVDIESMVFSQVAVALRAQFPGIYVIGEYTDAPASFPCVTISERSNTVYEASQDSGGVEHHATLLYEINVYSNKASFRKEECKSIASAADILMASIGFTRSFMQPTPNTADASIYRITARYKAVVDENKQLIYRG